MESVPTKDIAIAVLGGSAGIAAILLVFVGFLIVKAEALPEKTANRVIRKYTTTAKIGLIPLLAQIVVILSSYLWLFFPARSELFYGWSIGFPVALVLFTVYSMIATLMM
jgi:hypothetical protein